MIDKNYTEAKNYCRNPTGDPQGPYCFVAVENENSAVDKRSCNVRKCMNMSEWSAYIILHCSSFYIIIVDTSRHHYTRTVTVVELWELYYNHVYGTHACLVAGCSVAGIASDYLGTLDKTVSNRTCLKWVCK